MKFGLDLQILLFILFLEYKQLALFTGQNFSLLLRKKDLAKNKTLDLFIAYTKMKVKVINNINDIL